MFLAQIEAISQISMEWLGKSKKTSGLSVPGPRYEPKTHEDKTELMPATTRPLVPDVRFPAEVGVFLHHRLRTYMEFHLVGKEIKSAGDCKR
jgi:hypothetical protein